MKQTKPMVALITGDRNYKDKRKVWKELDKRKKRLRFVIEGGAEGADKFGYEGAMLLGIQPITLDANWDRFKKAAGPIRNGKMLAVLKLFKGYSKIVLAFHPNLKKSKETANMIKQAKAAKIRVKVFK